MQVFYKKNLTSNDFCGIINHNLVENAPIYAQISHHSHNSWKNIENPNFFCNRFFISHVLESVDNSISRLETRNAYRRKQRKKRNLPVSTANIGNRTHET